MALTGQQFREIEEALLGGYSESSLRRMVRYGLDKNLDQIAGGRNFGDQIFALIEWAEDADLVADLVRSAHEENPTNATLKALYDRWRPPALALCPLAGAGGAAPRIVRRRQAADFFHYSGAQRPPNLGGDSALALAGMARRRSMRPHA